MLVNNFIDIPSQLGDTHPISIHIKEGKEIFCSHSASPEAL